MKKQLLAAGLALLLALGLTACETDADMARRNLSVSIEQFEVPRRIVFFNGITDKYLLTIEGLCSVETGESLLSGSLEVVCKVGPAEYKKHFLGLSDNVSFFVEQTEPTSVDLFHYRVIFRPEVIIPDIDLETSGGG